MKFFGEVKEYLIGPRIVYDFPEKREAYLMKFIGKRVEEDLGKPKHKRSIDQNSYYWLLLGFLERNSENGYTADEWHGIFGGKFLRQHYTLKGGERVYRIKSTTELTTLEFSEYVEKVKMWVAQELHIDLPDADPGKKEVK